MIPEPQLRRCLLVFARQHPLWARIVTFLNSIPASVARDLIDVCVLELQAYPTYFDGVETDLEVIEAIEEGNFSLDIFIAQLVDQYPVEGVLAGLIARQFKLVAVNSIGTETDRDFEQFVNFCQGL